MLKQKSSVNYQPPKSLVEAEDRLVEKRNQVTRIDCQLMNFVDDGSMDAHNWLVKARDARSYKVQEIELLELWIRQHERALDLIKAGQIGLIQNYSVESVVAALVAQWRKAYSRSPGMFSTDEQAVLKAAIVYLENHVDLTPFTEA